MMLPRSILFRSISLYIAALAACGNPEVPISTRSSVADFSVKSRGGVESVRRVSETTFLMGAEAGEEDERPERMVRVSGFFVHKTELTVDAYRQCVETGDCEPPATGGECNWGQPGREDHPVNCVSWYDAVRYCDWAGGRLPTEAEWELAGRGEGSRFFPWDVGGVDCDRAVIGYGLGCGEQSTWPVGSKPAGDSVYGVSDLVGNVYEWTVDSYDRHAYAYLAQEDPVNLEPGDVKVLRGNSWYYSDPPLDSRLSNRYPFPANRYYPYVGFRCVFPGTDDALPFVTSNALSEAPLVQAGSGWMERNLQARALEGEMAFDTGLRAQEMVDIPTGLFRMGSDIGQHDERPSREVHVDAFKVDRYEVTVAAFAECVDAEACREPYSGGPIFPKEWEWENCNWGSADRSSHPINCVDWYAAAGYCEWAGKRLPTEAEWEKAARGVDGRPYPWGDEQPDCERAVIDQWGDGCGRETTWPVGSKPQGASPYGVEDMAGNVWEWVDDWYAYDYYTRAPDLNPKNTQKEIAPRQPGWGVGKVLRGGSWADQATSIHSSANRLGYAPATHPDYTIGFRCAMDIIP